MHLNLFLLPHECYAAMLPPDGEPSGYEATPGEPGLPSSPLEGALLLAGGLLAPAAVYVRNMRYLIFVTCFCCVRIAIPQSEYRYIIH